MASAAAHCNLLSSSTSASAPLPGSRRELRDARRGRRRHSQHRARPLLLISGTADHTIPDVVTRSTFKQYRDSTAVTEPEQFEGSGHSLTIDNGWQEVADAILDWLKTHNLN
jgi:pimeloyl-ACP methyl ester carboxylesterase